MHVKEGYFFTPHKQVTSPTWGPPPPCKQALKQQQRLRLRRGKRHSESEVALPQLYRVNIIGDELLFWREISALICNFTCEITKLPWQPAVRLSFKMATKF